MPLARFAAGFAASSPGGPTGLPERAERQCDKDRMKRVTVRARDRCARLRGCPAFARHAPHIPEAPDPDAVEVRGRERGRWKPVCGLEGMIFCRFGGDGLIHEFWEKIEPPS
jgi:hypothetical protein